MFPSNLSSKFKRYMTRSPSGVRLGGHRTTTVGEVYCQNGQRVRPAQAETPHPRAAGQLGEPVPVYWCVHLHDHRPAQVCVPDLWDDRVRAISVPKVVVFTPVFRARRLALQVMLALLSLRNLLFLIMNYSRPNDEEAEIELQGASHLFVSGSFGVFCVLAPFYWQFLAWRALKYRMHKSYTFYFIAELMLVDVLFRTNASVMAGRWQQADNCPWLCVARR